ncbi:MAG TPA: hypothetical protein VMU01_01755 [Rhizomicrobium sp.]|nr:hypothetical protein [Rhizomicrobium sp.]
MRWIKSLFVIAGIYDVVLGLGMLVASSQIAHLASIALPDPGYVEFPALLVALFGIMFLHVAGNPAARRVLIPYGMGVKASYSGVVFWHQLTGSVAALWIPLAWADFAFLVLFFFAWRALAPKA